MSAMNEKDYYAILGVSKDADKKEIQKAFQQKARKLHPDVNKAPDAEDRFKEVSEAYAVLSDDQKRARYDAMRSGNPFAGTGQTAPPPVRTAAVTAGTLVDGRPSASHSTWLVPEGVAPLQPTTLKRALTWSWRSRSTLSRRETASRPR